MKILTKSLLNLPLRKSGNKLRKEDQNSIIFPRTKFSLSRTPYIYMYVFLIACRLDSHSTVIHLSRVHSRVSDEGWKTRVILLQEEGERRKCVPRISWDRSFALRVFISGSISAEYQGDPKRNRVSNAYLNAVSHTYRINHTNVCFFYPYDSLSIIRYRIKSEW